MSADIKSTVTVTVASCLMPRLSRGRQLWTAVAAGAAEHTRCLLTTLSEQLTVQNPQHPVSDKLQAVWLHYTLNSHTQLSTMSQVLSKFKSIEIQHNSTETCTV